jgi:hypothetical protein
MKGTLRAAIRFLVRTKRTKPNDGPGVVQRLCELESLKLHDLPYRVRVRVDQLGNLLKARVRVS